MVYVLSHNRKPLMPCTNVIARLLLKQGKAKVRKREPFTIQLAYETTDYPKPRLIPLDAAYPHA
ncbi:RRXRR domain-containing protein [Ruminococcus sp. CLA-AA-H200]|uniref:RRXRR domain-containing protein n=2 Tax=Ruminococcus turbiniformis TaxID=2881258 RepID=A0ABS8G074_9FIRM|nr:RRXRR domain-containing protein [Ruminococcus turbiniformis]MCC2256172.1 RRXRR domain-containing protein [Ruminococcus turbiniformis]